MVKRSTSIQKRQHFATSKYVITLLQSTVLLIFEDISCTLIVVSWILIMASVTPLQALLFHEVWICLQHGNVLFNPLCQRLDRNYGISLFKNDMVWVIAFTLSAYWLREIVSMALCYRMSTQFTQKLILVSCGYHAFKIINVKDRKSVV